MNQTFEFVMDSSDEFIKDCQNKTDEIENLNTFCIGQDDEITYFDSNKNMIMKFGNKELKMNIMDKLKNAIVKKFKMFNKGYADLIEGKNASFYDEETQPMEISAMEYYSNGSTLLLGQKNGSITFVDS